MKLLYLGVYRDNTGYGHMAIDTMMAMMSAGIDVTARSIKLNNSHMELPEQIIEAESKPAGDFDVVVQNILPHMFDYCGRIPNNIGYYCSETSNFKSYGWAEKINTLDKAWVCNNQSSIASEISGVDIPISVIPIATDVSKYQKQYKPLSIRERLGNSFIFYFIGDFNKRKNIAALIKAFHLEFDVDEPVNLVIKTNIGSGVGDSFEQVKNAEIIKREIARIKEEMRIYPSLQHYKQEIILTGNYSEEEILRLHSSCDCFVCPSYGEAWCVPAFEAMALGKTPIVTSSTGFWEYMTKDTGWLVFSYREPVWGMSRNSMPGMLTGRESWSSVDIYHLMHCMREAYSNKEMRTHKAEQGMKRAYNFSYDKVGKLILSNLSEKKDGV